MGKKKTTILKREVLGQREVTVEFLQELFINKFDRKVGTC